MQPSGERTIMSFMRASKQILNQMSFAAGLALGLLGLVSCADPVSYAYFAVQVSIDPASVDDDLRKTIAACSLVVQGDDEDFDALPCTFNQTPYNLGVAEFSTNQQRGQLVFVATMRNLNNEIVAQGFSPPVAIVPDMLSPTAVVAVAVNPPNPMPGLDGGAPDTAAASIDAAGDGL